ncbi:MAG TPA: TolC family protein [Acidobacteriota bacterium]|nr:TolC family protein [Acidobacteriota bacterium]HQM64550.1 TolC family protein [Acidobacteriota bacterium]
MSRSGFIQQTIAIIVVAALVLAYVPPVQAQAEPQAQAQAEAAAADTSMLYTTILERAVKDGKARDLRLNDCIDLALRQNLDIEINRYQPLIRNESLLAANGVYDYSVNVDGTYTNSEAPITDILRQEVLGITEFKSSSYDLNFTFNRYLPTGGTATLGFLNSRDSSNTNLYNPTYTGRMNVQFVQPLWKNRSIDSNRRTIQLADKDKAISEIDFENRVSGIIKTVEDTYWDLVNAIEQQRIQIQSAELAIIQLRDNQKRVEIGTLAPIVITQTRAEVAQSIQRVISAEASIIQAENSLKNAITSDPNDPIWDTFLIPVDKPEIPSEVASLDQAVEQAFKNRPEIRSLNLELEKDDIDIRYYNNQTKPKFDFTATLGPNGAAGPNVKVAVLDENGNPVIGPDGQPLYEDSDKFTGRLNKVYSQIFSFDYTDWSVRFNFQYIFGNDAAKAALATARLGKDLNLSTLKQTFQGVRVEVLNAIQTIEVNRKSLYSATIARQFQEEQLTGQNKRFQAGLATNFEVLQTQRDLATARAAELSSLINLKKSIVALNKSTFTLLTQNQLEVALTR